MRPSHRFHRRLCALPRPWALAWALAPLSLSAQPTQPPASKLDAPLFYQLLVGEMELQRGQSGVAFQVLLDAARRTQDEALFRRTVQVAIQARWGNEALQAARAWKLARPADLEPLQTEVQLLAALGQLESTPAPLLDWLQRGAGSAERARQMAGLGSLLRSNQALGALVPGLTGERDRAGAQPLRRSLAACVLAQLAALSKEHTLAVQHLRTARELDPSNPLPAWLALRLVHHVPEAEDLITQGPMADSEFRLELAQARARGQRSAEALALYTALAAEQPGVSSHLYRMGALALELREWDQAQAALERYLAHPEVTADGARQAAGRLLLAQWAEQRGDWAAAEQQLSGIQDPEQALEVAYRRLQILSRQGKIDAAREAARQLPGAEADLPRRRLLAEVQVLREAKRWSEAQVLIDQALQAEPEHTDLLYEKAMGQERLQRYDDMAQTLQRVLALDPQHAHARNALGYSWADRNLRLPEARELIEAALRIAGQEPAIVDSLGWVAFREGRLEEAERWLRQAHGARFDAEIAAHLVEVLWARGQSDAARELFQQSLARDPRNEALSALKKRLPL